MESLAGVILSLCTAACWSLSPMAFASAGRRIGPFRVNLLRIALASLVLIGLVVVAALIRGHRPVLPGTPQIFWLATSGIAGMAIGDIFYYEALVRLGPRRALQLLTLSPVGAALLAWAWLHEALRASELAGISIVLGAVAYAIYVERSADAQSADAQSVESEARGEPGIVSVLGVGHGLLAALFAGAGAVLARQAFTTQPNLDALAATAGRVGAAALVLWIVPLAMGVARPVAAHLADASLRRLIVFGTMTGPVVGMICYVAALKYAKAGTVSTLSSMSPIMIIPLIALRYRTRIRKRAVLAAIVSIAGVALLAWRPA